MFINYFKIAIAVLKRRKFFTFISLFGISFTLTILMVLVAFTDHLLSSGYPDVHRSRELFISRVRMESCKQPGVLQSALSLSFFKDYASKLSKPLKMTVYTGTSSANAYIQGKKISVEVKYNDASFWEVYRFDFIEGKAFTMQQLESREKVAVISEHARENYFGKGARALGKYIEANNQKYRVVGVVRSVSAMSAYCYADVYLPYSLSPGDLRSRSLLGEFNATFLLADAADAPALQQELSTLVKKLPREDKDRDLIYINADSYFTGFARAFSGDGENSGVARSLSILGLLLFLFLLLPTINLVNINISRIMERSSEIGVRKAFGASSAALTLQFLMENIILTLIGGLLGILLSCLALYLINGLQLAQDMVLELNSTVLLYSLLLCLVFGLLSGVYPAWRMSRLPVVTALKINN